MVNGYTRVYIGFGANLGDGAAAFDAAWRLLAALPGIKPLRLSRLVRSEPLGVVSAQWFVNAVGELDVSLEAQKLLDELLRIEKELGRDRATQGSDRPLDLDLLFYGGEIIDLPHLRVPHPALAQRRFVLEPLRELAPHWRHPELNRSVEELAEQLAASAAGQRQGLG